MDAASRFLLSVISCNRVTRSVLVRFRFGGVAFGGVAFGSLNTCNTDLTADLSLEKKLAIFDHTHPLSHRLPVLIVLDGSAIEIDRV